MNENANEFLWAQKYRPTTVDSCILPEHTKSMIKGMISSGEIAHMIFSGGPGMGKTTLAKAIANELGSDLLYINASMERGIDILRTKIFSFASSVSLSDSGPKLIILDEADGATGDFQAGLKGFLEAFSSNCRFIFTANNKSKLIEPIRSRCTSVDFSYDSKEKPKIAGMFFRRVLEILNKEGVEYEQPAVVKLVERNFPDFRKTLNELQRHSQNGKIDSSALIDISGDRIKDLVAYVKDGNFTEFRKWVGINDDLDPKDIFRGIYDIALAQMKPQSLPQLVLTLADYGYKSAFCVDQQINTTACLVEIATNCEWL